MIETTIQKRGMVHTPKHEFKPDPIKDKTALKKQQILDIISEGSQLNLLGKLIDELATHTNYDSPTLQEARAVFQQIQDVLNS